MTDSQRKKEKIEAGGVAQGTRASAASSGVDHPPYFIYARRVNYHETDAMGVLHHSNHIKYFEEARVAWLRARHLHELHTPVGPYTFAVVALSNRYFSTARFDDELEVWVQSSLKGAKILFRYALWSKRLRRLIADGTTDLVPVNLELKPVRFPRELSLAYRSEPWNETWHAPGEVF